MKQLERSIDYLDLQVLRNWLNVRRTEDEIQMFDGDMLASLLFEKTRIQFNKKYGNYKFMLYESEDGSVFLNVQSLKTSIQLKGIFFLKPNWKEELKMIMSVIDENQWQWHVSRVDLALTIETDSKIEKIASKIDFKNLLVRTYQRKKIISYQKGSNANFEIAIYNKEEQLKDSKSSIYKDLFLEKYGTLENILRIDLRLKNKRTNLPITEALKKFDFVEMEKVILKETKKRINIKPSLNILASK